MKIKQIELIGFKSFSDRTSLAFHHGCTCIVGPNGCGKSNIVDAFRWVLGEQSAKSLRGERMEEVIFQGSASKKQKGLAEVSLIFTLGGRPGRKALPVNGGEGPPEEEPDDNVSVSRRLYRSGESEYLLNKRQCRLKDVRDIFLDTGLDVKSYSILDQGRIADILNAKPQDRRFLIEEIAGVMKYKVRKAEALSKLESSKQNLQRINDIVTEVKRQMNSLDRQVKKAERYRRLLAELREIELRIAKRGHQRLSGEVRLLESRMATLKEAESARRSELSAEENAIESARIDLLNREKALAGLEESLHEKRRDLAESEKKAALLRNDSANRAAEISRLTGLLAELDIRRDELLKRENELAETERSLVLSLDSLVAELSEKKQHLADIEKALTGRETDLEDKRRQLFALTEDVSSQRNDLNRLLSSLETLKYRESVSLRDMETVRSGTDTLTASISQSERTTEDIRSELADLRSDRDNLSAGIARLREETEETRALLARERETLASSLSRLDSLREIIVDGSLADFLSGGGEGHPAAGRVLSDVITAESDFEAAVEAAFADRINSLIIRGTDDLKTALAIVKERNLGRTAMLLTSLLADAPAGDGAMPLPEVSGAATRASEVVKLEGSVSDEVNVAGALDIMRSLLERIFVVDDIESALELRGKGLPSGVTLVTVSGEVLTPEGFIFAGKGREVLKRKREIKDLQKGIERSNAIIREREAALVALTDEIGEKRQSLAATDSMALETEKRLSLAVHSLENQREELVVKGRRSSILEGELADLTREREDLDRLIGLKTETIDRLEGERKMLGDEITTLNDALTSARREFEAAQAEHTELRLSATSCREKLDALRNEKETVAGLMDELEERRSTAADEQRRAEEATASGAGELQQIEEAMKAQVVAVEGLRETWASGKDDLHDRQQELLTREGGLRKIRADIDLLSSETTDLHGETVENRVRLENLISGIRQRYDLDIGAAEIVVEGFENADDEENLARLNDKVRELGPVNLGTLEEYDELRNRYDFLSKQQQDLSLSIAELEEAIGRINTTTRKRLREAYEGLRMKFREVFVTLFGGGEADILLTDQENILEAGLDVIARPPGKKLQNLNLLSGGEKALTSLALLFAGFLIKPSPLCILDEVDAALDESNTVRFGRMIRELSGDTQFIVITHNKATMEAADYLYGVTMEEAGVSKVMSLQFSDVKDVAYAS